jgi:hypothetical protein
VRSSGYRAADQKPRAVCSASGSVVPQYGTASNVQPGAALISLVRRNDVLVEHWAKIERTA